jgi:hypothetical protein
MSFDPPVALDFVQKVLDELSGLNGSFSVLSTGPLWVNGLHYWARGV